MLEAFGNLTLNERISLKFDKGPFIEFKETPNFVMKYQLCVVMRTQDMAHGKPCLRDHPKNQQIYEFCKVNFPKSYLNPIWRWNWYDANLCFAFRKKEDATLVKLALG